MKIDPNTFLILQQLRDVYREPEGIFTLKDKLYDLLIKDGHKIEFDKHAKEELWKEAIKTTKALTNIIKKPLNKEQANDECIKQYKSLLVKKYLLDAQTNGQGKLFIYLEEDPSKKPLRLPE